jgi:hypothetical protein
VPKPPAKPKVSTRKLKVFQAQLGFYDTVVATPSRAAALRAWGVSQDLFAEGLARPAEDPSALAAATAHPGVVLRRPAGSRTAFAVEPDALPQVPAAPKRPRAAVKAPKPPPAAPPPDRRPLERARAAVERLAARRLEEEARFEARREALEAEADAAQAAYVAARRRADAALDAARVAYRKAGGVDD